MPPDEEESERSALAKYLAYSHVGLQFFLSIGLLTGGGIWLDRRLGTVVLFTLVGLALGFTVGLYSLNREFGLKKKLGRAADSGKTDSGKSGSEAHKSDRHTNPGPRNSNSPLT